LPETVVGDQKQVFCENCHKLFQSRDSLNRHQKKCKVCFHWAVYTSTILYDLLYSSFV